MYAVLPSWIEPDFGYFVQYRPDQCPTPNQGSPNPTQTGLVVSQAGPTSWHAPLGRAPLCNPSWTRIEQFESF